MYLELNRSHLLKFYSKWRRSIDIYDHHRHIICVSVRQCTHIWHKQVNYKLIHEGESLPSGKEIRGSWANLLYKETIGKRLCCLIDCRIVYIHCVIGMSLVWLSIWRENVYKDHYDQKKKKKAFLRNNWIYQIFLVVQIYFKRHDVNTPPCCELLLLMFIFLLLFCVCVCGGGGGEPRDKWWYSSYFCPKHH